LQESIHKVNSGRSKEPAERNLGGKDTWLLIEEQGTRMK
jgi:hypothetical protein